MMDSTMRSQFLNKSTRGHFEVVKWLRRSLFIVIAAAIILILFLIATPLSPHVRRPKHSSVPAKLYYVNNSTVTKVPPTTRPTALLSPTTSTAKPEVAQEARSKLPSCSAVPLPLAKSVDVDENLKPDLEKLTKENALLQDGGYYKPPNCTSNSKIAILIPFRDREEHLQIFLYYMHPMLQHQQTEYCIYVIEQIGKDLFNRGMLFNVGVKEALKDRDYDCFALHDVDLIAENQRNLYHCPDKARHLSALIHRFKRTTSWRPYYSNFGGASIVRRDHFEKINGFSNLFWGWGGEDDDISLRLSKYQIPRERVNETLGAYTMLMNHHTRAPGNKDAMSLLRSGPTRYGRDGLNTTKYNVTEKIRDKLYTRVRVKLFRSDP